MADKIRVLYFLEDRAQERFIKALVERIAKEESIPLNLLIHDIRSARGGSRVINEFRNFMKGLKVDTPGIDLLVVAIDSNCEGYQERRKQLEKYIATPGFRDKVVLAVPDPHIERWYIMDQRAFKSGVGINKSPELPAYKCGRHYYKQILFKVLKESNVSSVLGGAEYAERIVEKIKDVDALGKHEPGFRNFIQDLRRILKIARHS